MAATAEIVAALIMQPDNSGSVDKTNVVDAIKTVKEALRG